jgi:hypothetical protein
MGATAPAPAPAPAPAARERGDTQYYRCIINNESLTRKASVSISSEENTMSNSEHSPTGVMTLPGGTSTDREVIRLLREEGAVVYFDCPGFDAYVKAPEENAEREGIVREFIVWYNDDYTPEVGWEQTSIDPLTLKRELRQREFCLVTEAPSERRIRRESDGMRETNEDS